ncbi:MAG: hypothetical protein LBI10_12045 [Deltaproteobacteria bacterium]|jgi:hypothetical protein|nr:hypothetical protein [Deltaproteobacteria bacterium]
MAASFGFFINRWPRWFSLLAKVVLFFSLWLWPTLLLALDDAIVQRMKAEDELFAYVENTIVTNWQTYPPNYKSRLKTDQIKWVNYKRDIEAEYYMLKGLSFNDAYTYVTAVRNNEMIRILPGHVQDKYVIIDLDLLTKIIFNSKLNTFKPDQIPPQVQTPPQAQNPPPPRLPTASFQNSPNETITTSRPALDSGQVEPLSLRPGEAEIISKFKAIWTFVIVVLISAMVLLQYYKPNTQ